MINRQKRVEGAVLAARQQPGTGAWLSLFVWLLTEAVIIFTTACVTSSPLVVPPGEILNFRGQASFYFKSPEQQGRCRLNFFFETPVARARLEVLNPLGGLESILWLSGESATLYLTSERLVWQGTTSFLLSEFLGGQISVEDLSRLLTGQVARLGGSWEITGETSGRAISGRKADLSFELKDYFSGNQVPRTIIFQTESYLARLRLSKIKFNQDSKTELFRPSFPAGAREVSWQELSTLWKK
ncbi:MAG: lipoprotein insertase outer membrane protein LolB [Candidatus Aminicenantales bacterium]